MFNTIPKKLKNNILLIGVLLLVFSCDKEVKIEFEEEHIETADGANVAINYPKAEGTKDIANTINKTLQDYIVSQTNFSEDDTNQKSIDDAISQFNNEYNRFKQDFPDSQKPWEVFIDGEVTYRTPEIICISINSYLDTGGAHGNTNVRFFNFDPLTGKLLSKKDLISNMEALSEVIEKKLNSEVESNAKNEPIEDFFFGKDFQLPETLGYSDEGLIVLYNPYEIASYSRGIIEFSIPFSEVKDLLKIH